MAEHTPGPWTCVEPGDVTGSATKPVIKNADHFDWVATVQVSNVPEWRANARLIAAAPDLLAALEGYIKPNCDCYGRLQGKHGIVCQQARAAIAKAKGEA